MEVYRFFVRLDTLKQDFARVLEQRIIPILVAHILHFVQALCQLVYPFSVGLVILCEGDLLGVGVVTIDCNVAVVDTLLMSVHVVLTALKKLLLDLEVRVVVILLVVFE